MILHNFTIVNSDANVHLELQHFLCARMCVCVCVYVYMIASNTFTYIIMLSIIKNKNYLMIKSFHSIISHSPPLYLCHSLPPSPYQRSVCV